MVEKNSKLLLINTIAQFVRSVFNMVLAFVATRIILHVLGVVDYGIYSVVAGAVSLLSFLTTSLSITTQRFFSYSQGEGDLTSLKSIFNTSVFLHIVVSIVVVLVLESLFPFLFNGFLVIPSERVFAAKSVYHLILGMIGLSLISSPFKAVIIAHENIVFTSIIDVVDAIFKLCSALLLNFVHFDKLICYASFLLLIQVFNLIVLFTYSKYRYDECNSISLSLFSRQYVKPLFSFAGWTMYNIGCIYGRNQGIAFIINRLLGPAVNAAYGLSFQVSSAFSSISSSLMNAINPQLMKAEGAGDRETMFWFSKLESKFVFLILASVAVPSIFEMPQLLHIWLGSVPENSVLFCRMVVLASLVDMLTVGLGAANQAIGRIRNYTLIIYSIKLSTVFFFLYAIHRQHSIEFAAFLYVLIELLTALLRLPLLRHSSGLNVRSFVQDVFLKEIIPIFILLVICSIVCVSFDFEWRFVLTFSFSFPFYTLSVYLWGLNDRERVFINTLFVNLKNKIIGKR